MDNEKNCKENKARKENRKSQGMGLKRDSVGREGFTEKVVLRK